ncbi:hypothetical protein [Halosimplex sp. J119]
MASAALLGALAGFFSALVTLGIPIAAYLRRVDRHAKKAVRLLTGEEEVDGDGVLPRLDEVEDRTRTHERALRQEELLPRTDGGKRPPGEGE